MKFPTSRRFLALFVFILTLVFANISSAQYRGQFFGSYQISNVEESGDRVALTIKVVLLNYSGKEIKDGGIVLYKSGQTRLPIGTFNSVSSLPVAGKVSVTQKFTVSKAQYTSWRLGEKPLMEMKVATADGRSSVAPVDLVPAGSLTAPIE